MNELTFKEKESLERLMLSTNRDNEQIALNFISGNQLENEFVALIFFLYRSAYKHEEAVKGISALKERISPELQELWTDATVIMDDVAVFNKITLMQKLDAFEKVAKSEFERLLVMIPQYSYHYSALGKRLIKFSFKDKGLHYLKKALDLYPAGYSYHLDYADYLPFCPEYADKKLHHYKICLGFEGYINSLVYRSMARIYSELKGDCAMAIKTIEEALAVRPENKIIKMELEYFLNKTNSQNVD
jgi:tetratricopeptide (TPR) repeat protein